MIYLASPYSHDNPDVRARRHLLAREYCARQMARGRIIFSPIAYGHQFSRDFNFPGSADFWSAFNERMMKAADEMHVLMIPGWDESAGVGAEIIWAKANKLKVIYTEPTFAYV